MLDPRGASTSPIPLFCLVLFVPPSEAKCLGAKTVCQKAFEHSRRSDLSIISELVTDQQALHAVQSFLGNWKSRPDVRSGANGTGADSERLPFVCVALRR